MGEKRLLDLVKVTGEESVDVILSDVLPYVTETYAKELVEESVAKLAGELVGAVFPRFNNIRLSYKQNRLEKNVSIMLEQLSKNHQILSDRIDELEKTIEGREFIHQSSEMLLDNIVDEIQKSKVQYNVNGYLNLLQTENANMDMALMFFQTLSDLNDIDIRVLKTYAWMNSEVSIQITSFNDDYDYDQLRYIREKLFRFGLLRSRNEEFSEKNQEIIIDYLQKLYKDTNSQKPRGVKLPRFKKLQTTDRYSITSLGMTLLQLISEQCDMSNISVPNTEIEE